MNSVSPYQIVLKEFLTEDAPLWHGVAVRKLYRIAKLLTGVSSCIGSKRLTPLHVAVMTGDINTARAFLEKGCNPNAKDTRGWTPLHHAALISNEMMQLLLQNGADGTIKNRADGTPTDLFNMANAPAIPLSHPIYALKEDGSHEEISREEFTKRTGAEYIEHPYIPGKEQVRLWQRPKMQNGEDFSEEFEEYLNNPPKLALTTETPLDDEGNPKAVGRSVVALEDIPIGAIVVPYYGEYTRAGNNNCGDHKLGDMDGARIRNLGPQLADGFPNAVALPAKQLHGAQLSVLVAVERIPKGTPVTWDYATHLCKWGGNRNGLNDIQLFRLSHSELRPKAMLEAVKSRSIAMPPTDYRTLATVSYILDTPSAFFRLILSKNITFEEVKAARQMPGFEQTNIQYLEPVLEALETVLQPQYALAKDCLLEAANRGRVQLVFTMLANFGDNPQNFISPSGPLSSTFGQLLEQGEEINALELFMSLHLYNQMV